MINIKNFFNVLKNVGLFRNIDGGGLEYVLKCLETEIKNAAKGETVLFSGDTPKHIGILLSGHLHIIREDYNGGRSILAAVEPGGIYAESLCCAGVSESPVTVLAHADSVVMLMRFSRLLNTCSNSCAFHTQLIANMLNIIAKKNLYLQERMEIVSLKSVRAKVMHYLTSHMPKQGQVFSIPFNREELADFLCVDRSALSHELAKMKTDGLIDYNKNKFKLN